MGGGTNESFHGTRSTDHPGVMPIDDFSEGMDYDVPMEAENEGTTSLAHGLVVEPLKATRKALGKLEMADSFKSPSQPVVPSSQGSLPSSILSRPAGHGAGVAYGPRLHKLMRLQPDQLDLSFVEKVIIPPGEVSNLCHDILQLPTSAPAARSNLNFATLNKHSVHVIGLYGSKKVLVDIFRSLKFSSIADLLMEDANVDPGMYGFLHNNVLYVFYWHQGRRLQEASRNDVSCNFIRYVADLCGTVYVCLDADDLEAPLMTTADSRASSTKQRTQRLKLSVVKQSEDDIKLTKGFHIRPAVMGTVETTGPSSGLGHVSQKHQKDVKGQDLPPLIDQWRQTYDIDVTQLPSPDLKFFVQYGELDGWERYVELAKSFDKRQTDHKNKRYSMDELVKQEEEKVLTIFAKAQKAYLQQTHPWEQDGMKLSPPTTASDPEVKVSGAGMKEKEMSAAPSTDPSADLMWANMELEFGKLWTSTRGNDVPEDQHHPLLVFRGTEVTLISEAGDFTGEFILEAPPSPVNDRSNVGPILYGEKFVATSKKPGQENFMGTCAALDGDFPTGPLLTCRPMSLQWRPSSNEQGEERIVKLVCKTPSAHGMFHWVASQGSTVPSLRKTAVDLSWLIANPSELFGAGISKKVLQKVENVLKSADVLGMFRKTLLDYIGPLLEKARPDQFPKADREEDAFGSLDRTQVELVSDLCKKVYSEACSELTAKLAKMVTKDIVPMIKHKMEFERKVHSDSMGESFKVEESKFWVELARTLSGGKQHGRTLSLTRCSPQDSQASLLGWLKSLATKDTSKKFNIEYVTQETEDERITWEMSELTPMKKDLNALLLQGSHVITPVCSTSHRLIEMDPSSESVFLVYPVKSGEILVFVHVQDIRESSTLLYMIPKLGSEVWAGKPIKTFQRGCDLVAVDESSKLLALYDRELSRVSVFRSDETFRYFDWCGIDLVLSEYAGCNSLTSMMFIPGKREIVLVDTAWKVRVFEISQSAMLRPRHISLAGPDHKICVSSDGSCLLVFYKSTSTAGNLHPEKGSSEREEEAEVVVTDIEGFLKVEVYLLDDSMSHLRTISLDYLIQSIESLDVGTVSYGSQAHLVLLDRSRPDKGMCSRVVQISSATEVCQIQTVKKNRELNTPAVQNNQSCPALEYMHLIFEKYATCPPLMRQARKLTVQLVLGDGPPLKRSQFKDKCVGYLKSAIDRLHRDNGKDFSQLDLTIVSDCLESCIADGVLLGSTEGTSVTAGDWARLLVCLVPIQIARAENNSLRPMIDGLQMPDSLNYANAVGLAEALRFGFYDAVLAQCPGPVKVISSMGKQSSGKSYLLNHLSGSLLDVAGGRCTDGVWMTMRASKSTGCLYVLLDFEGLGSFERSEQEDMLLSVLNAAVSNITIFNKKDFHLDKETQAVFERFQIGVSLVKQDNRNRLFKGLFYMGIKDVDKSDVEDLKQEFYTKIQHICSKSQDNFLTKMYGGSVEIAAMPPFQRQEYHDSVTEIAETVEELKVVHERGSSLAVDLKIVIAQISTRDWSPIDSKRVALKVGLVRKHFNTAINQGRLLSQTENVLVNFETHEDIPDSPVVVDGHTFDLSDTDLELSPSQGDRAVGDILEALRKYFQGSHKRCGPDHDDERWHSTFEKFLMALVDRRKKRILEWLSCNTCDFQDDGDVQKLRLEIVAPLADLKQRLSLCSSKCKACFLRCVLEKSHPGGSSNSHNCQGTHSCAEKCTFCDAEGLAGSGGPNECGDLSGHAGPHDCGTKSHTCGQHCSFSEKSSTCNENCALKIGHEEDHRCNTKDHQCNKECSSFGCKNSCITSLDGGDHDEHKCHERMCIMPCTMQGCNGKCGSEDHFHFRTSEAHFCGNEHSCREDCQAPGICEVATEVVRKPKLKKFKGKRSDFEYEHVSEQNGKKKQCCIPVPPWRGTHDGDHCHTLNKDAAHFCTTQCGACGYFCNLPIGHPGLHDTTHGNMRLVSFRAEAEDIDLGDRLYSWGESGMAEMCMMHCKARGRGHIHLIECKSKEPNAACELLEGARHQTQEYGPDKSVLKDELTHAAFWKHMRFKDPCQENDQKQFELCNHQCLSADHVPAATGSKNAAQEQSYCTEKLWHAPVSRTGLGSSSGYVTKDGHSFSCDHLKHAAANHVVFIIDRSGSMGWADVKPELVKFDSSHSYRLGCVYEAILRFIKTRIAAGLSDVISVVLFDDEGSIAVERQQIAENIVDRLLDYKPRGLTAYSSGLSLAQQILKRAFQDSSMQGKLPAVIFLSDGGNTDDTDPISIINEMQEVDHRLVFNTILFGKDGVDEGILKRMAAAGNGSYQISIDEVQLARSFEGLAKSLRPKVAALMSTVPRVSSSPVPTVHR